MPVWSIILTVALGLLTLVFLIATYSFFSILSRKDDPVFDEGKVDLSVTHYGPYADKLIDCITRMRQEKCEELCITSDDGKKLYAEYYDRGGDKTAIMVHGYRSNPLNNFSYVGGKLLDKGYNLLFIHHRVHGKSGGKLIGMGQFEYKDVLKWIDLIAAKDSVKEIVIYGTSMGAATVGYLSDKITTDKVKLLVMDCGFTSYVDQLIYLFKSGNAPILSMGIFPFFMWGAITGVKMNRSTTNCIKNTKIPMCFIHGEKDTAVPIEHSRVNFEACPTEKLLITVPDAGHTTSLLVGGEKKTDEFLTFLDACMNK
ncbi:MAG: alpha/beta hydrolase [Clostridiales bacterium]|nr:alpha/beta hydrolase [Clostridiales bacterium]